MTTALLWLLACSSPTPAPPATPVAETPVAEATPLPSEPTPQPPPGPSKPPRALPDGALSEHLRPDERFAHATFLGPLGPSPELSFAVVQRENKLYAWVLPAGATQTRVDGPALHDEWTAYEVAAVMFPTVSEQRVAVVLAQCITGVGPTGAEPFPCNAALRWDGAALTRDPELERALATARTAIDVRKALP